MHQDFGYQTDGVLVATMSFDGPSLKAINTPGFPARLVEAAQALPGGPLSSIANGRSAGERVRRGHRRAARTRSRAGQQSGHNPGFRTLLRNHGIPILRGRAIDAGDARNAPAVAVISESAARRFFGSANPVGRVFTKVEPGRGPTRFDPSHAIEIVGITHDLRYRNPRDPFEPILFLPITQVGLFASPDLVVHAAGNPLALVESVKRALADQAPGATFSAVRPLSDTLVQHVRRDRTLAWLSGAFGAVALVLAAVGLYGVIAYAAELRTREMGIRLALGARPAHVHWMLLGEVARLLGAGLAIGLVAALVLTRSLESLLFELTPQDPATLAAAAALLSAVAVTAGYLPARRAAKLDPTVALRQE